MKLKAALLFLFYVVVVSYTAPVEQNQIKNSLSRFDKDVANIASEIAADLKLSPDKPLYITYLPEDKEYMLPMEPVFDEVKSNLKQYASEVIFRSPDGSERNTLDDIMRRGSPLRIDEIPVDSLILTGSYFLMNHALDRINCVLEIQDIRAVKLYKSKEFTIYRNNCTPALQRLISNNLQNKKAYAQLKYRGIIIKKLEELFKSGDNNLLIPPAVYAFENRHPYAVKYQVNALKDILTLKYGISSNSKSLNKIIVPADGTLIFIRDEKEWALGKIIDGEPLFGNDYSKPCTTYRYRSPSSDKSFETKKFTTQNEIKVRDKISEVFNKYYPAIFGQFQYDKLDKIFYDKKEPTILVGNVISTDPNNGKELVKYTWMTKQHYLAHLKRLHDIENHTFEVRTQVMSIYNDDNEPDHRYWAIIRQNWKTKDIYGETVYQDDGFLFVNFDFTADKVLKDFKIYYRLWFYEYQYDDIELGIKRYQKLEKDITKYFKNGIKGLTDSLKKDMCDYLIGEIRRGGGVLRR